MAEAKKPAEPVIKKECNCRGGTAVWSTSGKCLDESIVWKADVTSNNSTSTYIGLAANSFKEMIKSKTFLRHPKVWTQHQSSQTHLGPQTKRSTIQNWLVNHRTSSLLLTWNKILSSEFKWKNDDCIGQIRQHAKWKKWDNKQMPTPQYYMFYCTASN